MVKVLNSRLNIKRITKTATTSSSGDIPFSGYGITKNNFVSAFAYGVDNIIPTVVWGWGNAVIGLHIVSWTTGTTFTPVGNNTVTVVIFYFQ